MSDKDPSEGADKRKMIRDKFFKSFESITNAQTEGHEAFESLALPLSQDSYAANLTDAYEKLSAETQLLFSEWEREVDGNNSSLFDGIHDQINANLLELMDGNEFMSTNPNQTEAKKKWRALLLNTISENALDTSLPEDLENANLSFINSTHNSFFKFLNSSDSDDKPPSLGTEAASTPESTCPASGNFLFNPSAVALNSKNPSDPDIPMNSEQAVPSTSGVFHSFQIPPVDQLSPVAGPSGTKRRRFRFTNRRRGDSDNSSDESPVDEDQIFRKQRSRSSSFLNVPVDLSCGDFDQIDFTDVAHAPQSSDVEENKLNLSAGGPPLDETRCRSRRNEHFPSNSFNELVLQIALTKADLKCPIVVNPRFWKPPFLNECMEDYEGLQVEVTFLACTLKTQLTYTFDRCHARVDDQVARDLRKFLIIDKCFEYDEFLELLKLESEFRPYGGLTSRFILDCVNNYEVYLCNLNDPQFEEYHRRMKVFDPFFFREVTAVSNLADNFAFTVYKTEMIDSKTYYRFVGYVFCYKQPNDEKFSVQLRQVLVLPIYRGKGVGKHLILSVYKYFIEKEDIVEITTDFRSEIIDFLMTTVELEYALELSCCSRPNVKQGITPALLEELERRLHLPRGRSVQIYEMARLYWIKRGDPWDEELFRREVTKRMRLSYKGGLFNKSLKQIQHDVNVPEVNKNNIEMFIEIAYEKFLAVREPVVANVNTTGIFREFTSFNVDDLERTT